MLKHTLIQALEGEKRAVKRLCDIFRRVSVAYLRTKANSNTFLLDHLYKDIDDLALDCIADLFGQEGNCLNKIEGYISKENIRELSESQVEVKVRQLIFSSVNDGLYRNYKKLDPSLSKIIRNLKRALVDGKVEGAEYDSKSGDITVGDIDKNLPVIADEILEIKLSSRYSEINNSVDAIRALADVLSQEDDYNPKIKLVNFAVILRKVSAYRLEAEEAFDEQGKVGNHDVSELKKFVSNSITEEKVYLYGTYVESGKINKQLFEKYLLAVKDIVIADYVSLSSREGYFEHLSYHLPELSYERYRADHRQIIEYVVKKVRAKFLMKVKKEKISAIIKSGND